MPYRPFECLVKQLAGSGGLLRPLPNVKDYGARLGEDGLWHDVEDVCPRVTQGDVLAAFFPRIKNPNEAFRNLPGSRDAMLAKFLEQQGRPSQAGARDVLSAVYEVLMRDDERSIGRMVDWPATDGSVPFYAGAPGRALVERLAEEFKAAGEDTVRIGRFRETAFWLCASRSDDDARMALLVHLFASCLLGPDAYAGEMSGAFHWARRFWAGRGTRVGRLPSRGAGPDADGRADYGAYVGRGGARGDWSLQEVDFDQGPGGGCSTVGEVHMFDYGAVVRLGTAVMEGDGFVIGVPVSKEYVSRLHATLRSAGGEVVVEDEGSSGGTLVLRHLGALDGTPASCLRLGALSEEEPPVMSARLERGDVVVLAPDMGDDGRLVPNSGEAAFRFRSF